MKLTTSLLLTVLFISLGSLVFAQSININTAKIVAQNQLQLVGRNQLKSASLNRLKYQFSSLSVTSESKDTLYFVLNDTIHHSFVIVAGDRRSSPIIGYSLEGNYDVNNQPPAFVEWMENRKQEIAYIKQNNLQADRKINQQWDNLSSTNSEHSEATTFVEPLLKTKWDQGCYYNSMCPSDEYSTYCGHVPAGCVATAMAQVMKYWNYPTTGTGSHSYLSKNYGSLTADFGSTTYQWSQMPNELTSQNDAVATLMYHCGVALEMIYDKGSSGGYDPRDELVNYFNYSPDAHMVYRSRYTASDWIYILKSELDQQHPIYYEGYQNCSTGHAFICDGYQNNAYFHFNWGWGGLYDGYFYLGSLNPAGNDFNSNQRAVINILPGSLPGGYNGFLLSTHNLEIGSNGGTSSLNILSSANWMAASNQTWATTSSNTGISGTSSLTVTATENNTGSSRTATIVISAVGYNDQLITINQPAKVNVTPGGLHNILTTLPTPITHLTLTGSIDARDFKTLRDDSTMLSELDLSDIRIVKYVGAEGTMNSNMTYPANTIPYKALYGSFLKNITIPKSVTSIDCIAFSGCSELTTITISSLITAIGNSAFQSSNALINVDKNNPNYSSMDGVLFNKTQTTIIQCPVSKAGNYSIPSSVTSIGEEAFWDCNKLTTVTIPSSVTSIGRVAFHRSALTAITIPSSVTFIGESAFYDCPAFINVETNNVNYSSMDGVLFNKTQTTLIQCPVSKTNYTIPTSVISIGSSAFSFNNEITTLIIPSSVKTIESFAFLMCAKLTTITIPSLVNSIGNSAFSDCKGLKSIYVSAISPVDLNNSIDVFRNVNKDSCTLYVPSGTKSLYSSANQWKDFTNIVEINLPVANAGSDQSIIKNSLLTLDGSASSYPDHGELTYLWIAPLGITLNSNTIPNPTFIAPEVTKDTIYTFFLTVSDDWLISTADQMEVTVKHGNYAPVANAGIDRNVIEKKVFQLYGNQSSDNDNESITYQWTAPEGIELNSTTVSNPTFTAPEVVIKTTFMFSLVVNDGHIDSPADQVVVTVYPSKTPIDNASNYQIADENSLVTLDGSASSDPENDKFMYLWTAPAGLTLSSNTISKPTLITPEVSKDTTYLISLLVKDNFKNSLTCQFRISVVNNDKVPYLINPISNITVDKTAPDQVIDLQTVFADDDLGDILSYTITSNTNDQVVMSKLTGCILTLSFSSQIIGSSDIVITANSNGKEVISKFNVEVKIPTAIDPLASDQKLRVFPNPTFGKVKVEFNQIPQIGTELIVTDIKGKNILKQVIHEKEEWIDLTGNAPGIYLLKTNIDNTIVQKVILK